MNNQVRARMCFLGCTAQVSINGFTVYNHNGQQDVTFGIPVNEWLKDGENRVSLAAVATGTPAEATATITITGSTPTGDAPLNAILQFDPNTGKGAAMLPLHFALAGMPYLYSRVEKMQGTPTAADMYPLYEQLRGWFNNKDEAAYLQHMEIKIRDFTLAYGLDTQAEVERQREYFHNLVQLPNSLAPLRQCTVVASPNLRLFSLETASGRPPLIFDDDERDAIVTFPFQFGKLYNQQGFQIIR